jgi:hypothetical protein
MAPDFDDEGNYGRQFTVEAVREAFETIDEPVIITSDVAEQLGCSGETARKRLNDLYDAGVVNKRTFGQQTVWWQLPPETAEERSGLRARRISQENPDQPIVFGEIVYYNGEIYVLTDEQAATVESAVEEAMSDD